MKRNHLVIAIIISIASYFIIMPIAKKIWTSFACYMSFVNPSDDIRFSKLFKKWKDKTYVFQMGREKGEYAFFSFRAKEKNFIFHTFEISGRDIYEGINIYQQEELNELPDFLDAGYKTRTMDISNKYCFSIPSEINIKIDGELTESFSGDTVRVWKGHFHKAVIVDGDIPLVMFTDTKWNIGSREVLVTFRKGKNTYLTIIKRTTNDISIDEAISLLNISELSPPAASRLSN